MSHSNDQSFGDDGHLNGIFDLSCHDQSTYHDCHCLVLRVSANAWLQKTLLADLVSLLSRPYLYQMPHFMHHATNVRTIFAFYFLIKFAKP